MKSEFTKSMTLSAAIALGLLSHGDCIHAAELRAGIYHYDANAGSYQLLNGQNFICDHCPPVPPLKVAAQIMPHVVIPVGSATPVPPVTPAATPLPSPLFVVERAVKEQPKETVKQAATMPIATVQFRFDSSVLSKKAGDVIQKALLDDPKVVLRVDGYTCRIGSKKHNKSLSLRRAQVVARFISSHGGRVTGIAGLGSTKSLGGPLAGDRRAEIWIKEENH